MFMSTFLPAAFSFTGNRKKAYIQTLWEGQVCRWPQVGIAAGEVSCAGANAYFGWQQLGVPAVLCCCWQSLLGHEHACESSKSTGELRVAHPQPCSDITGGDVVFLQLTL